MQIRSLFLCNPLIKNSDKTILALSFLRCSRLQLNHLFPPFESTTNKALHKEKNCNYKNNDNHCERKKNTTLTKCYRIF